MLRVKCPHCERILNLHDRLAGKRILCPDCKERIQLPAAAEDEPKDEPPRRKGNPDRGEQRIAPAPRPRPKPHDDDDEEPPPRRRRLHHRDEDEEEPPRPRRSRNDDDDDDDRPRSRRRPDERERPRRKSKTSAADSSLPFGFTPVTLASSIGSLVVLLLVVLALVFPPLGFLVSVLGFILGMLGGIWFIVVAFQDEPHHGILCLLCGPYALFYLVTHLDKTGRPFFVQFVGILLMFAGVALMDRGAP